jgi:glycosyltransferase involved in cell wall biosynthesis
MTHIGLNAHLLSGKAGYRTAGIHGYIYNTLMHLPAVASKNWRFTAMVGAENEAQFDGMTMRHSRWDTESPLRRILWEQFAQPGQLREFDLYHALAFVAPLWLPVPMVVTIYDLSFLHYPQVLTPTRRLYLRGFTRLTCQRASRVIAISQSTARDVVKSLNIPTDKVDVAVPGYNSEIFRVYTEQEVSEFRRIKNLPERFWLFIGTLEPRKNLPTLLEAYANLPENERPPLLIGGGKGWQYDEIFATVERRGLQDSVQFLGFVPAEELPLWYNSAELFVYPSVFEGFGLPVLEAMACGTPVIVSDASSLPEVAGSAGMCIPPHDLDAWTQALYTALTDAAWHEQARIRGLEEVKRYTWGSTAQATLRSYECALNPP